MASARAYDIPLLVLHDFDAAGIIIKDTLENDTRRYSYSSAPNVIDLGLSYGDIAGLPTEPTTPPSATSASARPASVRPPSTS